MAWTAKTEGIPGETILAGRFVQLVPLAWPEPAESLANAMAAEEEDQWTHMTIGPFHRGADLLEHFRQVSTDPERRGMAILTPGGEPIGMASFLRIRPLHGSAELGAILYGHKLRSTPGGTEAMLLMMKHLFDDLGWRRCEWKCNALNARSARAAERLGFVFEGIFRQDMWLKGKNRDTRWYSMLDSEWPRNKAALEAWLADDNFDTDGQQKRKLESFR